MSIPFKNDDRPYQLLHYCDKLLGGPGLDKDLAQAFFCAAGVDDADVVVRVLRYWLTNRREFPKPADIAAIAPTCTGGVTYQFLEDDKPRHASSPEPSDPASSLTVSLLAGDAATPRIILNLETVTPAGAASFLAAVADTVAKELAKRDGESLDHPLAQSIGPVAVSDAAALAALSAANAQSAATLARESAEHAARALAASEGVPNLPAVEARSRAALPTKLRGRRRLWRQWHGLAVLWFVRPLKERQVRR